LVPRTFEEAPDVFDALDGIMINDELKRMGVVGIEEKGELLRFGARL
jgi:hypothetical protein